MKTNDSEIYCVTVTAHGDNGLFSSII